MVVRFGASFPMCKVGAYSTPTHRVAVSARGSQSEAHVTELGDGRVPLHPNIVITVPTTPPVLAAPGLPRPQ